MLRDPLRLFLVLAFGISWGIFFALKAILGDIGPLSFILIGALFMLGPAIAALITRNIVGGISWADIGITWKGIVWKWVVIAVAMGLALAPLTLGFNWLFSDVLHVHEFGTTSVTKDMIMSNIGDRLTESGKLNAEQIDSNLGRLRALPFTGPMALVLMLLVGVLAGCSVNMVFTLGEEIGWRGMLLHVTRPWGFAKHVFFTGIIWGLWHAPMIVAGLNYPDHPFIGIPLMCVFTTLMAVPMAWVRVRSACIWAPAAMHGTVNATAGAVVFFTRDANVFFGSPVGLSGMCSLALISAFLLFADRTFIRDFRAL